MSEENEVLESVKKGLSHTVDLNIKFVEDTETPMTFKAYGSVTGNKDLACDIMEKGCYKKVISKAKKTGKYPKLLYQHRHDRVIGVITKLTEDDNGLLVEGQFIDTTLGRDVYQEVKSGAIDSMSVGFYIEKYTIDSNTDTRVITLVKELSEISFVTFPANPEANVLSIKQSDGTINAREIEKRLRDAGFSRSESKALISGGIKSLTQRDADNENSEILKEINNLKAVFTESVEKILN